MNKQVQLQLIAMSLLLLCSPLVAQQPAVNEIYQDFRNKRPLSDDFRFRAFDQDNEMKPENEGLRVTLPAERGKHNFFEVNAGFPLEGDFEFTATYEILSAKQPLKGFGVGVNLTISTETQPRKFGKLCRVLRAKDGSVYVAETFLNVKPSKFKNQTKPTEVKAGQLRLARIGPVLHYLVSDGPGQPFEQIWEVNDYGTDVVTYAGFQVGDSGEPGNPVDARLIDLRFRLGKIELAKAATPAPLAVPAPADENVPPRAIDNVPRWFIGLIVAGVLIVVLLVIAIVVVFLMRRRKPAAKESVGAKEGLLVICTGCGKKLKTRRESAGKKLKCPGCGQFVAVPV